MMMPWKKKKLIRKLAEAYGKEPDCEYYAGDMDWIRTYYDGCRTDSRDPFYVDETTWNDLNLDEVFRRILSEHSRGTVSVLHAPQAGRPENGRGTERTDPPGGGAA